MKLFLSTTVNKVDAKGRVSLPASFRGALSGQDFHGVILFPSHQHKCLEGFGGDYMEAISERLENLDFFSSEQDDLATTIFGESVQVPLDKDGRIILSPSLREYAGLEDQAAFVGLGKKFQIWSAEAFEARQKQTRKAVLEKGLTLPKGGAHE